MGSALTTARARWAHLPSGLLEHLERVSQGAENLAQRWGVDPEEAALAGFLHDVARAQPPEALLRQARELNLPIDPVEEAMPLLLHGPVAAALIREELQEAEEPIAAAICWHTTGRWGMTDLEKVVFLADKLDPDKLNAAADMQELVQAAEQDLDQAVLRYLDRSARHLLERGGLVHPATIEARNWLLLQAKTKGTVTLTQTSRD